MVLPLHYTKAQIVTIEVTHEGFGDPIDTKPVICVYVIRQAREIRTLLFGSTNQNNYHYTIA